MHDGNCHSSELKTRESEMAETGFGLARSVAPQECICFSVICLSFFSMIYGTFISPEGKGSEMSEVSLGSAGVMNC